MITSEKLSFQYNESIFKQTIDKNLAQSSPPQMSIEINNIDVNGCCISSAGTSNEHSDSSVEFENLNKIYNKSSNTNHINNNNNSVSNGKDLKQQQKMAFLNNSIDNFEEFIHKSVDEIIKNAVLAGTSRTNKVIEWHEPNDLKDLFDFKLRECGENHDKLIDLINKTIKYSVKVGHPYFINQLYSGVDPYAMIGQWCTDALNPSVYTYEVAPIFTLMEEEVLREMRRIVGFPNDGNGDGIFCPGGSIANGYAISCARYKYHADSKKIGLFSSKRLIIFTSEDAHYSIEKLAMFMGFGSDNVCKISTNKLGKMDIDKLIESIERNLKEGCQPLMVSATAGTTVLGAFDDLNNIADICKKYNMWMHVDAAWGGGALLSEKHSHLLKGIARADSVTWNPHKLLTAAQQCSTFLTSHKQILSQCHSTNATYLFQKDKFYDTSYDTGDKHIQCGRRADVFKFWFMWKAKGTKGFQQHVDHLFEMAKYFTEKLKLHNDFDLILEKPEFINITFWYIPPSLRNIQRNEQFYTKLHCIAPKIKERMIKKGSMMITYQPLREIPNFFRLVLQNPNLTQNDMDYFINEIELLGKDL